MENLCNVRWCCQATTTGVTIVIELRPQDSPADLELSQPCEVPFTEIQLLLRETRRSFCIVLPKPCTSVRKASFKRKTQKLVVILEAPRAAELTSCLEPAAIPVGGKNTDDGSLFDECRRAERCESPRRPATAPSHRSASTLKDADTEHHTQLSPHYSEFEYWDERYVKSGETAFEWYCGYARVRELFDRYAPARTCKHTLMLGCGNSAMSLEMVEAGYAHVLNVDISPSLMENMRLKHAEYEKHMSWKAMDVRRMTIADGTIDLAVDKGTLDAIICGENGEDDVEVYLSEVDRVMAPNGVFVLISLAEARRTLVCLSISLPFCQRRCPTFPCDPCCFCGKQCATLPDIFR